MDNNYIELIKRFCEGVLSPEDEKALLTWVRASQANAQTFRQAEREWRRSNSPSLEARLSVAKARNRAMRYRNRAAVLTMASSLAAVILLGVFLFTSIRNGSQSDTASLSEKAQAACIKVPMASTTEVTLPDGTNVFLNAGSSLSYGKHFNKKDRNVYLQGEAYFDVVKNADLPFIVHTEKCKMTVLGTRFNVYSYAGEGSTYAALIEGSLRFEAGESSVLISPDEMAAFDGMSIIKSIVDAEQYISWINGEITYDEISLSEFLSRLSRLYNVEVSNEVSSLDSRKFRASFTQKESIENILKAVGDLLPISYTRRDGGYMIKEK